VGSATDAWVAAGLSALTGPADGPGLAPPESVAATVVDLVAGAPVDDPLALLGERAALAAWSRQGRTSCGGGTRLLSTADGWLAVNLARADDVVAVPAWLGVQPAEDPWPAVADAVAGQAGGEVEGAAVELGLAVAVVAGSPPPAEPPILRRRVGDAAPLDRPPVVVDLSSLWAGPLCGHLLQLGGARVVKVEATGRPDGGRADTTGFFDRLHHGQASVALDLPSSYGLAQLRRLLASADVVIEGSRPRALQQWGIGAEAWLAAADGPRVWLSVTAHGREAAPARVGFGDDAAAAGGLVAWTDDGPWFLADAVADPLTGIAAHAAVVEALAEGGTWLLDAALSRVAASVAAGGSASPVVDPPSPRARPSVGPAPELGADTAAVLAALP
jgi:crotonobetainyl-CoA:carnitine CoA-transferase CaiB-like acyl-CoA transferase